MAVTFGPFSSGSGSSFSDTQWGEMFNDIIASGVIKGAKVSGSAGGDMAVTTGAGLAVNVATGQAIVYGRWVQNDASLSVSLSTADPSLPRIDYIVVKMDNSAKTMSIVAKTGTPAGSPSAPSLTQTSTTWESPLATVRVNAGATTPSTITDQRAYAAINGISNLPSGTTLNGATIWTATNDGSGSGLDADTVDGLNSTSLVQVGSNNAASTPVQMIVVSSLPAAGHKGRIAFVAPFSLP